MELSKQILDWWGGLPWFFKIPAVAILALMVITLIVDLIPWHVFQRRGMTAAGNVQTLEKKIKISKRKRSKLKKELEERDRRHTELMGVFDAAQKKTEKKENEIRDCNSIECVDSILRRSKGPRGGPYNS